MAPGTPAARTPSGGILSKPRSRKRGRRGGGGRHHISVDADRRHLARRLNQDGNLAADRVHLRVHDALDQRGGNCRVHGVSAGLQDVDPRHRREVMFSRNSPATPPYAGDERAWRPSA